MSDTKITKNIPFAHSFTLNSKTRGEQPASLLIKDEYQNRGATAVLTDRDANLVSIANPLERSFLNSSASKRAS